MSILKYFQTSLPNPEQTGIRERTTASANTEVSKQLKLTGGKKRKLTQPFQTRIERRYAAENGNSSTLKKSIKSHKYF